MIDKISTVLFLVLMTISCSNPSSDSKIKEIKKFDAWRHRMHLAAIDDNLKLDSTFYYTRETMIVNWSDCSRSLDSSLGNNYLIREYYSKQLENNIDYKKLIVWSVDSGNYKLDWELDEYTRYDTPGFEVSFRISLGLNYYEKSRYKTYIEIDTIPTEENERNLINKFGLNPQEGYWVCGQTYMELFEREFPERHVELDTNQIEFYLKQFCR